MYRIFAFILVVSSLFSCEWFGGGDPTPTDSTSTNKIPDYLTEPQIGKIPIYTVDAASGVADSRTILSSVWVHEDNVSPNFLTLLSHQGEVRGKIQMPFRCRDWEDIAIGKGPIDGISYVYLADIGDNIAQYNNEYYIYRFAEPKSVSEKVTQFDKITFKYPDGSRDAETIMLDPATKDIYIVTKREFNVRLYQIPYPQATNETITAKFIQNIELLGITAGDISTDGKEIILRNYIAAYYWYRNENESIAQALARKRDKVFSFTKEKQEEGICFEKDGKGIFSIGERDLSSDTPSGLYYYKKK